MILSTNAYGIELEELRFPDDHAEHPESDEFQSSKVVTVSFSWKDDTMEYRLHGAALLHGTTRRSA
jgi:hypothetical protein